ncbi:hypothetical protein SS50377_24959 [Spironucleus salmonicida]|uniref:Uncharacterized protein n=1 Tax=Spironucleus salmonicida TaxID=348837 RepID=A0A9P8LR98_9EUKA|nr:hypothetical protein SS50377_24945 [Spironucleus salmonicida]KAH0572845.1 hypothetical protein SS50377_24959 [Spironucleus salmonicida]
MLLYMLQLLLVEVYFYQTNSKHYYAQRLKLKLSKSVFRLFPRATEVNIIYLGYEKFPQVFNFRLDQMLQWLCVANFIKINLANICMSKLKDYQSFSSRSGYFYLTPVNDLVKINIDHTVLLEDQQTAKSKSKYQLLQGLEVTGKINFMYI